MPLTDAEADVIRKMILVALENYEQPGPLHVLEVFYGPRHNELGFKVGNGVGKPMEVVVVVKERSWG